MTIEFTGTDSYVADKDLMAAVNAAIRLERPLPVKGEPGGGKTELARQVASALGLKRTGRRASARLSHRRDRPPDATRIATAAKPRTRPECSTAPENRP